MSWRLLQDVFKTNDWLLGEHQSSIDYLIYASIAARPDLSSAVGDLSQCMLKPGEEQWIEVKRIFHYIKGTLNDGLLYQSRREGKIHLQGYADSDWAGDVVTWKSTSLFKVRAAPVSWSWKCQSVVALSSTEAEYIGLSHATQEVTWLRSLLKNVGFAQKKPTIIFEDNQGSISLAKNPKYHSRTKHIDINCPYIPDVIVNKVIPDVLTKGVPRPQFEKNLALQN